MLPKYAAAAPLSARAPARFANPLITHLVCHSQVEIEDDDYFLYFSRASDADQPNLTSIHLKVCRAASAAATSASAHRCF